MRTFPLTPVPPGAAGFDLTLVIPDAPPPGTAPGAPPCACADLDALWFNGTRFAVSITTDEVPAGFGILGTICPDTTYETDLDWTPEGAAAEPTIDRFAASSFAVYPVGPGLAEITVTATCAGVVTVLPPLFLTIVLGAYVVQPCDLPTEFTNLLNLPCVSPVFHGVVGDITTGGGGTGPSAYWTIVNAPFYQNGAGTVSSQTCISFTGLSTLFAGHDMMVRVTVINNSMTTSGGFHVFVDNHESTIDSVTTGATWTYPVDNADIVDFFTGAGVGDGAGGLGNCSFRVEVKAI